MASTPPPSSRRTSSTQPIPSSTSRIDELDVTDPPPRSDSTLPLFSPSGTLSSLKGTTHNTGSQIQSPSSKPQNSRRPTRTRHASEDSSSSSGSEDEDEESGGLGDLVRSLHESNETQSLRQSRRKRAKPDQDDSRSVHSRRTESGSTRGPMRRNGSRLESLRSAAGSRLGRVHSAASGRTGTGPEGEEEDEGEGALPTVEEKSSSFNSTNRPPPPAPSASFTHRTLHPPPLQHPHHSLQVAPISKTSSPNSTTSDYFPRSTSSSTHLPQQPPSSPSPLPPPNPQNDSPSILPRFNTRLSSASTLDPRRHLQQNHQDLNHPFIPEVPRQVQSVPRRIGSLISSYLSILDPGGRASMQQDLDAGTAPLSTISALIATT